MAEAKTKPGFMTSEFWLTLVAELFAFLMMSGVMDTAAEDGWISKIIAGAIAVLAALGYTSNRTKTKTGT